MPPTPLAGNRVGSSQDDFENLKRLIHGKLVDKLDLSRLGELEGDTLRREIRLVVEHLCDTENRCLIVLSENGSSRRSSTKPLALVRWKSS